MNELEYNYLMELLSQQHLKVASRDEMGFIMTLKSKLRKERNKLVDKR